jgi:hypothetical protein
MKDYNGEITNSKIIPSRQLIASCIETMEGYLIYYLKDSFWILVKDI